MRVSCFGTSKIKNVHSQWKNGTQIAKNIYKLLTQIVTIKRANVSVVLPKYSQRKKSTQVAEIVHKFLRRITTRFSTLGASHDYTSSLSLPTMKGDTQILEMGV